MICLTHIDHYVLTVRDIALSMAFYQTVLGMQAVTFGNGRKALQFGHQKINLHQVGKEFEPKAHTPMPGSADLCFITADNLDVAMQQVKDAGVSIIEGPVKRTGAQGDILSFYIRDPDGNLIEIASY